MRTFLFALLILVTPLAPVAFTGCSTAQIRVTYNTLGTVGQTVNTAYAAWNDQVVAGKTPFNASVADKYNTFQKAYAVAVQAASMNPSALAPSDLVNLANETTALIHQFTK